MKLVIVLFTLTLAVGCYKPNGQYQLNILSGGKRVTICAKEIDERRHPGMQPGGRCRVFKGQSEGKPIVVLVDFVGNKVVSHTGYWGHTRFRVDGGTMLIKADQLLWGRVLVDEAEYSVTWEIN